jgi:hypothetical protein
MLTATTLTYSCRVVESLEFSDSRRRANDANIAIRYSLSPEMVFATDGIKTVARAAPPPVVGLHECYLFM